MHSNTKNPKYNTKYDNNNADEADYEEESDDLGSIKRKNNKLNQLCIDIEMNQSVQNLLSSPDQCDSAMLDVTIIRPSGRDNHSALETNIMKASQVRKLLTTLDRKKRDKKLIKELFEDKAPSEDTIIRINKHNPRRKMQAVSDICYENTRERKFLKSQLHRQMLPKNICSSSPVDSSGRKQTFNHCYSPGVLHVAPAMGENLSKLPSNDSFVDKSPLQNFKCGDHKKTQHVYAAPRTFKDLNSIITCQSMSKDNRSPCLCDHCGIASLLSETQKRPIITAPVEHVSDLRRRMNRKEYKEQSKHDYKKKRSAESPLTCEDKASFQAGLAHLYERLKILEERMDIQEERAVPKDYFKRIITKIISHFSPRENYRNDNFHLRDTESSSYIVQPRYKNKYSINTLLVDKEPSQRAVKNKSEKHKNLKKLLSDLTENMPESRKTEIAEDFWRWGDEILKPGVDLKNKILSLLDLKGERLQPGEKVENRPKTEGTPREIRRFKNCGSNRSLPDSKEFDSSAFQNFMEAFSAKMYKSQKRSEMDEEVGLGRSDGSHHSLSDTSVYKKTCKSKGDPKSPKKSMIPKMAKKEMRSNNRRKSPYETAKKINISYLNPKMSTWQEEESQISFRLEFSDADTNTRSKDSKNRDLEKLEFLRTLSRTKDSDKERLWDSIWAQAKANGQTKQDKVTIQLPRKNGSEFNDMIEIEFTIGEIEYMLTKHKYADKNKIKS